MKNYDSDTELSLAEAVTTLGRNDMHFRVLRNAQHAGYLLTDEHFLVIDTLIEHYRKTGWSECLYAQRELRYLADRFSDKGGNRYLQQLFHKDNDDEAVLQVIHDLTGLPALHAGVNKDSDLLH